MHCLTHSHISSYAYRSHVYIRTEPPALSARIQINNQASVQYSTFVTKSACSSIYALYRYRQPGQHSTTTRISGRIMWMCALAGCSNEHTQGTANALVHMYNTELSPSCRAARHIYLWLRTLAGCSSVCSSRYVAGVQLLWCQQCYGVFVVHMYYTC